MKRLQPGTFAFILAVLISMAAVSARADDGRGEASQYVAAAVVVHEHHGDRHRGYVLDNRYHHNHYYPPHGYVVRTLPAGYRVVHYHRDRYYFRHGIWYSARGAGFVVVTPPVGIVVPILPLYYTRIWVRGVPYFYAGGVYYVWRPAVQGYVVVEAPGDSDVDSSDSAASGEFYVYPKKGQSEEQQTQDRYECHRWSVKQTGFDPSQPPADTSESQLAQKRDDYRRAISACLEARDYSVK